MIDVSGITTARDVFSRAFGPSGRIACFYRIRVILEKSAVKEIFNGSTMFYDENTTSTYDRP